MSTPLRVLLLEDRPADAELVVRELRRAGFDPAWQRVETEADYLAALDPGLDLVLADYQLPGFDALRALELRQYRALDVPVIVVSGTISDEVAIECMKRGAADYLLKDRLARLGSAVQRVLEARRLRDERRRAEEALRESEERFRSAFEDSAIGMALQGADGRYLRVNRALCAMLGYSAEELVAMVYPATTHPEDREVDLGHDRRMLAGETSSYQREKRYLHKGGHVVWALASVSLVRDRERRPLYFVVQAQDITDRKLAEDARTQLQGQLAQSEKLAAMGQLLAGVAHELNNPLAVVMGQANLLRQSVAGGPVAVRAAKIAQAAERCARIVKNFLALARQRPPEREPVALNQVVQDAVELMAYSLRVDDVEVTLDLAGDLPLLWADPHQLHQVVINLVSNAHHAMRGTPTRRQVTLATWLSPDRQRVILEVADTGPGIPAAIRSRIFEPFFTTKPAGQGTGLGLALCQGIVEGHGGAIRVESPPDQGAVFLIELPVVAPRASVPEHEPVEVPPPVRSERILVVDDEPEVAAVLAEVLAADGHDVETARNGAGALEKLAQRPFSLILSDLKMPELDGPGLYREVACRYPDLRRRFVFLTGDTLSPETTDFLSQTDVASLSKPFTPDEVRRAVHQALRLP